MRQGVCAWAVAVVAVVSRAQPAPSLKIGDPAPPLTVGTWLKGGPVTGYEPGKVYVIELGATWAPGMADSVPALSGIQQRFAERGVTVIGVFVRENRRTDPAGFVQERGAAIGYAIGTDDVPPPPQGTPDDRLWAIEGGRMSAAWLRPMGRDKLPAAFVVDGAGRLAWTGLATYPRGELEEALTRVLAGTLTAEESLALSASYRDREGKIERATVRYRQAVAQRDFKTAVAITDELIALAPSRMLTDAQFVGQRMVLMLKELRDETGAYEFARKVAEGEARDNARVIHALAWVILDTRALARRDLDLALKLAKQADQLTEHKVPLVLDTLARAHFERNELDAAIEAQGAAVGRQRAAVGEAAPERRRAAESDLASMEATLKRYTDDRARRTGGGG